MTEQNELGEFFSNLNTEELDKAQETFDKAPERQQAGMLKIAGKYLMKVRSFCGKKKDDGGRYIAPKSFVSSKKKVLMLNVVLEVVDGTEAVPEGAILFHSFTLLPGKGASPDRIEQVMRFMKPTVKALTGLDKIEISQDFFHEYLEIECSLDPFVITKDHHMKENVMVTVEEEYNDVMRRNDCKVKFIAPALPGDKSLSQTVEEKPNASLDQEADNVKASDINLDAPDESAVVSESDGENEDNKTDSTVEDY